MDVENYNRTFANYPPLVRTSRWVYGVWMIGNNYRNASSYYGAYPPGYLKRVAALFPRERLVLHLFSGMVAEGNFPVEVMVDIRPELRPSVVADAQRLPFAANVFDLILADPPYTRSDASQYNCPMPNRKKVVSECARVLKPGKYLVWLDTVFPMFRRSEFELIGTIGMVRSTNHRTRFVFIFQKLA